MENLLAQVIIGWDVILIELFVLFAITILIAFISVVVFNKSIKEFNNKHWNYVLKHRRTIMFATGNKNIIRDNGFYMIALSYFEINDDQNFYKYISKIVHEDSINRKYFWLAVYYLLQDNEEYQIWFNQLKSSESFKEKELYIKRFMICEKRIKKIGELCTEERQELESIHSDRLKRALFN